MKLDTARRGAAGYPATWLEMCTCPDGYVGEFCESCGPGFRHEPASGGPFAPCVPCNCNGHADICDNESGISPFFSLVICKAIMDENACTRNTLEYASIDIFEMASLDFSTLRAPRLFLFCLFVYIKI